MEKNYYDLTEKDIFQVVKLADKEFERRVANESYSYDELTLESLKMSYRTAFLIARKEAKRKFTPKEYR